MIILLKYVYSYKTYKRNYKNTINKINVGYIYMTVLAACGAANVYELQYKASQNHMHTQ